LGSGHKLLLLWRLLLRRLQLAAPARHRHGKQLLVAALPAVPGL